MQALGSCFHLRKFKEVKFVPVLKHYIMNMYNGAEVNLRIANLDIKRR
jgi:hypothetical protein